MAPFSHPRCHADVLKDLMITFTVVDPSNFDPDLREDKPGLRINCFTRNWEAWLPRVQYGDVVILRKVWVCVLLFDLTVAELILRFGRVLRLLGVP